MDTMTPWTLALTGWALAAFLMLGLWLWHLRLRNAGAVDVGWTAGVVALSAPALMLYFLFRVTGVPATEAQALRSRGGEYRRYQETTSAFVPWFPRRAS